MAVGALGWINLIWTYPPDDDRGRLEQHASGRVLKSFGAPLDPPLCWSSAAWPAHGTCWTVRYARHSRLMRSPVVRGRPLARAFEGDPALGGWAVRPPVDPRTRNGVAEQGHVSHSHDRRVLILVAKIRHTTPQPDRPMATQAPSAIICRWAVALVLLAVGCFALTHGRGHEA